MRALVLACLRAALCQHASPTKQPLAAPAVAVAQRAWDVWPMTELTKVSLRSSCVQLLWQDLEQLSSDYKRARLVTDAGNSEYVEGLELVSCDRYYGSACRLWDPGKCGKVRPCKQL